MQKMFIHSNPYAQYLSFPRALFVSLVVKSFNPVQNTARAGEHAQGGLVAGLQCFLC